MVVPTPNPTKDKLFQLMSERDHLEAKIDVYGRMLESNANVGMQGALIDADGFPRNDIDVYQVRQARQQIICLQNDHKELMKQIEVLLHQLHSQKLDSDISNEAAGMQLDEPSTSASSGAGRSVTVPLTVIVKVNLVSPGSPAENAGLCVGDEIMEFGTINCKNFVNLAQIGRVVHHMQNQRITLKIRRVNNILDLILIPKSWSGRGLLGCNIVLPDDYDNHRWVICCDLKLVAILTGLKKGFDKHQFFLCLWVGQLKTLHYADNKWEDRISHQLGRDSIDHMPLVPSKIILKLGLIRNI